MQRLAIASIVGALILFIFMALVHTVLPVHNADFKYTPAQDTILSVLSSNIHEDGYYILPNVPPGTPGDEHMKMMESYIGKPMAWINYRGQMEGMNGFYTSLIMSFIYNLLSVLILCIALAAASDKLVSSKQRLWFVMLFALFTIFSQVMMEYNWIGTPMHYLAGTFIDLLVGYFLVGCWLAWYYGRLLDKNA